MGSLATLLMWRWTLPAMSTSQTVVTSASRSSLPRAPTLPSGALKGPAMAFRSPRWVAVDTSGNVYVADRGNQRIQKFSSAGVYITQWSVSRFGDRLPSFAGGIAVDTSGNVYVSDVVNHRIRKFSSAGAYLAQWGSQGTGDGQFSSPGGLAVDTSGAVYVADTKKPPRPGVCAASDGDHDFLSAPRNQCFAHSCDGRL